MSSEVCPRLVEAEGRGALAPLFPRLDQRRVIHADERTARQADQ